MKKILYLFIILFLFAVSPAYSQDDPESILLKQFHTINSEEMMTWMEKLCSPEFNGRLNGNPGISFRSRMGCRKAKGMGIKTGR